MGNPIGVRESPDVSVVILNWNTRDLLAQALKSLHAETKAVTFETIVVDNGSIDGSAAYVEENWPFVRLIRSPTNLGFAGGNNLGLAISRGRYILVLNNDTIIMPSTLTKMAEFLDKNPATGCVGCRVLNPDSTLQRSVASFPSLTEDFLAYTEMHRLPFFQSYLRRRFAYWGDYDRNRVVDWVVGACMMIRREVLDEVGGLDDGYFIYAEEIDWCYRMRLAGWLTHYVPDAEVVHIGGASMDSVPDQRIFLKIIGQYRFYRKFYAPWRRAVWRLIVAVVAAWRICLIAAYRIILAKVPLEPGRRQAIWHVITREPVVTDSRVLVRAWWRILLFVVVGPRASQRLSVDRSGRTEVR